MIRAQRRSTVTSVTLDVTGMPDMKPSSAGPRKFRPRVVVLEYRDAECVVSVSGPWLVLDEPGAHWTTRHFFTESSLAGAPNWLRHFVEDFRPAPGRLMSSHGGTPAPY